MYVFFLHRVFGMISPPWLALVQEKKKIISSAVLLISGFGTFWLKVLRKWFVPKTAAPWPAVGIRF